MQIFNRFQIVLSLFYFCLSSCQDINCRVLIKDQLQKQNVKYNVDGGQINIIDQQNSTLNITISFCIFNYDGNQNTIYISDQISIDSIIVKNVTFEEGVKTKLTLIANNLKLNQLIVNIQNGNGENFNIKANDINIKELTFTNNFDYEKDDYFFEFNKIHIDEILFIQSKSLYVQEIQFLNISTYLKCINMKADFVSIQKILYQDIYSKYENNESNSQLLKIECLQKLNIGDIKIISSFIMQYRLIIVISNYIQIDQISFPKDIHKNPSGIFDSAFTFESYNNTKESYLLIKNISLTYSLVYRGNGDQIFETNKGLFLIQNINKISLSNIIINQTDTEINIPHSMPFPIINIGGYFFVKNCIELTIQDSNISINSGSNLYNFAGGIFAIYNCKNVSIMSVQFLNEDDRIYEGNQLGGFIYIQNSTLVNLNQIHAKNSVTKGQGGFGYIETDTLIVQESSFINCKTYYQGGTFYISSQNVEFNNVFISDSYSYLFGGAIYFHLNPSSFKYKKLKIQNCQSYIGGGIMGYSYQNSTQIELINNTATLYGDNFSEIDFRIKQFGEFNEKFQQYKNEELKQKYYFRKIEFNQTLINEQLFVEIDSLHNFQSYFMEIEFFKDNQIFSPKNISMIDLTKIVKTNQTDIHFVEQQIRDTQKFSFYFTFSTQFFKDHPLEIQAQFILNNKAVTIHSSFKKQCFSEQIYDSQSSSCDYCCYFRYIPKHTNICYVCQADKFDSCEFNEFNLKKGFWRESESSQIYQCPINPLNCIGGGELGNSLCAQGRIGEECLECDLKGVRNQGEFTRSVIFECSKCSEIKYNLVRLLIAGLLGLLFFILICEIIQSQQRAILIKKYLNATQVVYFGTSYEKCNYSGNYLKLLVFYIQIINICSYQSGNPVLKNIVLFQVNLYNPLTPALISVDCYLQQLGFNFFSIPYLRVLIATIIPFCLVLGYIFCTLLKQNLSKNKKRLLKQKHKELDSISENEFDNDNEQIQVLQDLTANQVDQKQETQLSFLLTNKNIFFQVISFLFFCIFAFPITDQLVSATLCRKFQSQNQYSIIDFTLPCDDQTRLIFVFLLFIPIILFFTIILPIFMFIKLFQNRKKFDDFQVQFQFGYVYKQYKRRYYYWEFIRFFLRLTLIFMVYSFYENFYKIALGSIIVLSIYQLAFLIVFPYTRKYFNYLELMLNFSSIFLISVYFININTDIIRYIYLGHIQALIYIVFLLIQFLRYSVTILSVKFNKCQIQIYSQRNQDNIKRFRIITKKIIRAKKNERLEL